MVRECNWKVGQVHKNDKEGNPCFIEMDDLVVEDKGRHEDSISAQEREVELKARLLLREGKYIPLGKAKLYKLSMSNDMRDVESD